MKRARLLFDRLSLREKSLLLATALVVLLIWASFALQRFGSLRDSWAEVHTELATQRALLEQAPRTEATLARQLERFNPENTFTRSDLAAKVNALFLKAGINNPSMPSPSTEETAIMSLHSVTLNFSQTPVQNLEAFARLLRAESPYITIERVMLRPDSRNPNLLNGQFRIKSLELREDAPLAAAL